MSTAPFPRPVCGMTLDEMRLALEHISGETRATAAELHGADAQYVGAELREVARLAEEAHWHVMGLIEQRRPA